MIEPLVVSGVRWAQRHKRKFDAVLTLEDPALSGSNRLRFHRAPHPDHLVLRFVDMDRPAPPPYTEWPVFRLASRDDVEAGLAFGLRHERLLVHCHAGVGRSTAMALGILAARLGDGREDTALSELLRIRPEAVPNLHVVSLVDDILERGGDLLDAVVRWDGTRPENAVRRILNRRAHFSTAGIRSYVSTPRALPDDL